MGISVVFEALPMFLTKMGGNTKGRLLMGEGKDPESICLKTVFVMREIFNKILSMEKEDWFSQKIRTFSESFETGLKMAKVLCSMKTVIDSVGNGVGI